MDIPEKAFRKIADEIASDTSPVGIDAKKTHIMILHQLNRMEARLRRIEDALEARDLTDPD